MSSGDVVLAIGSSLAASSVVGALIGWLSANQIKLLELRLAKEAQRELAALNRGNAEALAALQANLSRDNSLELARLAVTHSQTLEKFKAELAADRLGTDTGVAILTAGQKALHDLRLRGLDCTWAAVLELRRHTAPFQNWLDNQVVDRDGALDMPQREQLKQLAPQDALDRTDQVKAVEQYRPVVGDRVWVAVTAYGRFCQCIIRLAHASAASGVLSDWHTDGRIAAAVGALNGKLDSANVLAKPYLFYVVDDFESSVLAEIIESASAVPSSQDVALMADRLAALNLGVRRDPQRL